MAQRRRALPPRPRRAHRRHRRSQQRQVRVGGRAHVQPRGAARVDLRAVLAGEQGARARAQARGEVHGRTVVRGQVRRQEGSDAPRDDARRFALARQPVRAHPPRGRRAPVRGLDHRPGARGGDAPRHPRLAHRPLQRARPQAAARADGD